MQGSVIWHGDEAVGGSVQAVLQDCGETRI